MDSTIPAVKAALHRGRARLRELAGEPDDAPVPVLPEAERSLLARYIERFNARDFDAQAVSFEQTGDADAIVFPEIGVALVSGEAAASLALLGRCSGLTPLA